MSCTPHFYEDPWEAHCGPAPIDWNDIFIKEEKESMKKRPFQYMVIVHKFEEKDGDSIYKDSEIVIDLKTIMAKSEKDLAFRVTREIPEVHAANPENVEIIIRPF